MQPRQRALGCLFDAEDGGAAAGGAAVEDSDVPPCRCGRRICRAGAATARQEPHEKRLHAWRPRSHTVLRVWCQRTMHVPPFRERLGGWRLDAPPEATTARRGVKREETHRGNEGSRGEAHARELPSAPCHEAAAGQHACRSPTASARMRRITPSPRRQLASRSSRRLTVPVPQPGGHSSACCRCLPLPTTSLPPDDVDRAAGARTEARSVRVRSVNLKRSSAPDACAPLVSVARAQNIGRRGLVGARGVDPRRLARGAASLLEGPRAPTSGFSRNVSANPRATCARAHTAGPTTAQMLAARA